MENNHLTYFKIENFKKFDSLEVNDIGQFNLIVGDNNVGKTCLLEAFSLGETPKELISSLYYILGKRKLFLYNDMIYSINNIEYNFKNNIIGLVQRDENKAIRIQKRIDNYTNYIYEIENKKDFNPKKDFETNEFIRKVNLFDLKNINELSKNWLVFKENIDKNELSINFLCDITSSYYKDFSLFSNYFPLVKLDDLYANDLIDFFRRININPNNEDLLLKLLNKLFDKIQIKRIIINEAFNKDEFIQISTVEKENYHPITEYGDGFVKIFRIVLELFLCKNRFICIDELDSGIHYSRLKEFWISIFILCKELNVQLFATSHSKECIEAYVEALNAMDNIHKDVKLIKLKEITNKKIKAITYPFNEFGYLIETDSEIR